jgi:hypothetical protein
VKRPQTSAIANWAVLILILLFCLEAASRRALSSWEFLGRIYGVDSTSSRLGWVHAQSGRRTWNHAYAEYDPSRGWALRPNSRDVPISEGIVMNTNSRGIRGVREYPYSRTPGKQRIVVLGASFSFGLGVADEDTFSRYLETSLPDTEVLNLGVPGYGDDQMLLYLQEEGIKYHPDVVLLGFTYVEMFRNIDNFNFYAKPRFQAVSGGLRLRDAPVPTPEQVRAREPWRPKALELLEILWQKARWHLGRNGAESRAITRLLADEIARTARGAGAIPVFVQLAVYDEIAPTRHGPFLEDRVLVKSPPVAERERFFYSVCQEAQVPCLILGPRFRVEAGRGVDLNQESHWNRRAHALAGEEIRQFLLSSHLVPAQGRPAN